MKKLIILIAVILSALPSCNNYKGQTAELYKYLDALYELSEAKSLVIEIVWSDAIMKNQYDFNGNEMYVSDFNRALFLLSQEATIKDVDNTIDSLMVKAESIMKNISSKKHESYEKFLTLYINVTDLAELSINPSGSLKSYRLETGEKIANINSIMKEINFKYPEFIKK